MDRIYFYYKLDSAFLVVVSNLSKFLPPSVDYLGKTNIYDEASLKNSRSLFSRKSSIRCLRGSYIGALLPFSTGALLLYSQQTENWRFSDVFLGYRSGKLIENGLSFHAIYLCFQVAVTRF